MKNFNELLQELSLAVAKEFATQKHSGQTRKLGGAPYVTHPTAAVNVLKSIGIKDRNILSAALLHDTLEDTATTYNELKKKFNKEVAGLVKEVSSNRKLIAKEGKESYLANKMINMSNGGLLIKLADRLHNLKDLKKMPLKMAKKHINKLCSSSPD